MTAREFGGGGGVPIGGVVLAGGRSARFGSEKAVAVVDGSPMIARILGVLHAGCTALAVNARTASGAAAYAVAHDLPVLADAEFAPDGPLAGVLAALHWASRKGFDRVVTAPCDTPRLPADLVARLVEVEAGAYAMTADGPHPLCAIWCIADLPTLEAALSGGRHPPVRALLADLGYRGVAFPNADAFANLNTPDLTAPTTW